MAEEMRVFVCSTPDKAAEAKSALQIDQFTNITVDGADIFHYDSATYGGGTRHEGPLLGKIVVIGKK